MRKKIFTVSIVLFLVSSSFIVIDMTIDLATNVRGTIIYVGGGGSGNYTAIQEGIDAAGEGDTVFVYNGTYYENVEIHKTIYLVGEDKNSTIIDGGGNGNSIFLHAQEVNITGFTITKGGKALQEGGISLNWAQNCKIFNNNISANTKDGIIAWWSDNNYLMNNIISNNDESGISLTNCDKNHIENNSFFNNIYAGVGLDSCYDNIIKKNEFKEHQEGILLSYSLRNNIERNHLLSNNGGINLRSSPDNYISNNIFSESNHGGLGLSKSRRTTITNNSMMESGIWIWGTVLEHWNTHNIDPSNTVNGNPIYYWKNQNGGTIPLGAGQVILVNCSNITISNQDITKCIYGICLGYSSSNYIIDNNVSNSGRGIYLYYSDKNFISDNVLLSCNSFGMYIRYSINNNLNNNNISNSWDGIYFYQSSNNMIANTTSTMNSERGIYISGVSDNNTIIECNTSNNKYGISINGMNNVIINNLAFLNGISGIEIYGDNNSIINNTIYENNRGIYLRYPYYTTIVKNTISNNGEGIHVQDSGYTDIYHNILLNNTIQANDFGADESTNMWNNTYPSGGNYWSDYNGNDSFKGPNQNIPGSDGIGDTPYDVDSNTQDNYPLMQPYKPLENYTFLRQSWNLISIPLIQEEQNLTRVLGSIDGWYNAVQWYDSTDSDDPWKHHNVGKPYGNDLFELNETMGFWIHITNPGDTIFLYNGTQPSSNQTITLHEGWNLVGYPSQTSHNRTVGLNNLTFNDQVDAIWTYDASSQKWNEMGESDYFELGRGYYIHAKTDCEWEVPL